MATVLMARTGTFPCRSRGVARFGDLLEKEILEGVFKGKTFRARNIPRDGARVVHYDTTPESVKSTAEVVPQGVG